MLVYQRVYVFGKTSAPSLLAPLDSKKAPSDSASSIKRSMLCCKALMISSPSAAFFREFCVGQVLKREWVVFFLERLGKMWNMGIHRRKEPKNNIDHYLWPGLIWGAFSIDKEGQQHFVPRTGVPNFQSLGLSKKWRIWNENKQYNIHDNFR